MKTSEPILIDNKSDIGVLMLHGFTSAPGQFKELAEFLSARNFTVYAPAMAGHGTSPDDLIATTPQNWKESIKNAYTELRKKVKKVIIIGNSFGSNMGFWLIKETNNEPAGIISLGAPIYLKWHRVIKFRLATYGRFKKFYHKPKRIYKTDYTDMNDEVSYSAMPTKSIREFIGFIEQETRANLDKVKVPILIANANGDNVIDKKSAAFIYSNIGSARKEVFWFPGNEHGIAGAGCEGLFPKIYSFIKEII